MEFIGKKHGRLYLTTHSTMVGFRKAHMRAFC